MNGEISESTKIERKDQEMFRGWKMRKFEYEVLGLGTAEGTYAGQFTPVVSRIIMWRVAGCSKVLHLYSGSSKIGNVRVDLTHSNATHNMDVFEFIDNDESIWDYTILDPPYLVGHKTKNKLGYKGRGALSADVSGRGKFKKWANEHTHNILWLDYCTPIWNGFNRTKLWFLLPGKFDQVRILSELKNKILGKYSRINLDEWL